MKSGWVQTIVILLIGFAVGFGFSVWKCQQCPCHKKAWYGGQMIEKMSTKLELSQDQKDQVAVLLDKKHEKMKEIWNETREEIKGVLREEQVKKFDELATKCKAFAQR